MFGTVAKMVAIRGSYVGNRRDSAEAIDFFRQGLIHVPFKVITPARFYEIGVYDFDIGCWSF